jgi:hypothetical protein
MAGSGEVTSSWVKLEQGLAGGRQVGQLALDGGHRTRTSAATARANSYRQQFKPTEVIRRSTN